MKNELEVNKLYICLGNIGKEYEKTRHNAGFIFGERFSDYITSKGFQSNTKDEPLYKLIAFPSERIYFLFPKTLMNLSGKAVSKYLSFTNKVFDVTVVHDDLDLLLGDYKILIGKGPKTHNGLTSVEDALNTKDFERIRIGIENRNGLEISGLDYVLYKFDKEETEKLDIVIQNIIEFLETKKQAQN